MDFIYRGSVNVPHDLVGTINQVANLLAIRGIVSKESNTNAKQVGDFLEIIFVLEVFICTLFGYLLYKHF